MRLTKADLDIERPKELFQYEMDDGTVYDFIDPKGLHLEITMKLENLPKNQQVKVVIADGKFDDFLKHDEVDGYFMEGLMKAYTTHFGLGTLGEGNASLHSLNRTARRSKPTSKRAG